MTPFVVSKLLDKMRIDLAAKQSYGAGNLLNLLLHIGVDMSDLDFSQLTIRQAYLQGSSLPGVNFSQADLSDTMLTDPFGHIHVYRL